MTSATVGIIANPASARDIRRLVAHGGAITTYEKLNRLQRVLAGLAAAGIERVVSMSDRSGITAGLLKLASRPAAQGWPALDFVDQEITHSRADTTVATETMVADGVGAIVVLGGDGTNGAVGAVSGEVPLVSISTGTNNAFPRPLEPTVAGLCAGLLASKPCCRDAGTYRAKKLVVRHRDRSEEGLVDVAISSADGVGSGAVWDPALVSELFLTFAEPDAIGLSAIASHVQPVARRAPHGIHLTLGQPAPTTVRPPIAPGLLSTVGVRSRAVLEADTAVPCQDSRGVIAVDGERVFTFGPDDRPVITLQTDGPVVADVEATLAYAASNGLLSSSDSSSFQTNFAQPKTD